MKDIYINCKVYTGGGEFASAFAVENGSFTHVGDRDSIPVEGSDAVHDMGGRFVCAGFNDSHMHLLNFGQTLGCAPLSEHTRSLSDMLQCLRRHLESGLLLGGKWLLGRGWNQDLFKGSREMPTKYDLDTVSADIPIMVTRTCGHCCILNSKALELSGITSNTPQPEGGRIGMTCGEPDGRLFDNAMDLVEPVLPLPSEDELKAMIRAAASKANSCGITSVQTDDYCVFRRLSTEAVNDAYRELEKAGELTVRVYEQCNFTDEAELENFIDAGNITGNGSELFKIGPLKLLGDGALGSRTAHLTRPYPGTDTCGFSLFAPEKMASLVKLAHSRGMQVAIHAIGDACLDEVLNSLETAMREFPRPDPRHGVVHCQASRADQLERIARLKLHVYAQSVFLDYDNHIVGSLLSQELAATSYNWKTLMVKGVSVSNGSDCPVEYPDALRGIECAVTRTSLDGTGPYLPDQAFTVAEAIDSFTLSSAEASFEENVKGRIAVGQYADFTVLGGDPFKADPRTIHSIPVIATYLAGRPVFEKESNYRG